MTTIRSIEILQDCLEVLGRIKSAEFELKLNDTLLEKAHPGDLIYTQKLESNISKLKENIENMNDLYRIRRARLMNI